MAVDLGKTVAAGVGSRSSPDHGARAPTGPSDALPRLLPQISKYTILGTLGRGGMGLVYKGYDPELDRHVAIKLFHRRADDVGDSHARETHARAIREAQALARLSHPNIVAVHEVGSFEGQIFIVMEYVLGETLREWLAHRPPYVRVLEVFVQIAQALAAAHRAGIIHRDLKPENVVVRSDGHAQVLDFGLARTAEVIELEHDVTGAEHPTARHESGQSTTLTSPGDLIGTPAYMAPEQLLRERACERSDQYAFCVCLYEALQGVRPFFGATIDALRLAVLKGEIREPARPAYPAPSYLHAAVLRGLSFTRAHRFASMDALLVVLVGGKRRRQRRHALLGALGLAAALGGAAVATRPVVAGHLVVDLKLREGSALAARGEWSGAERALHAAATIAAEAGDDPRLVDALTAQARVRGVAAPADVEALRRGELALALATGLGPDGQLRRARALRTLADLHARRDEPAPARQRMQEAVALLEVALGVNDPETLAAREWLQSHPADE